MSLHLFSKVGSTGHEVENEVEILFDTLQERVVQLISQSCIVMHCRLLIFQEVHIELLVLLLLLFCLVSLAHTLHHACRSLLLDIYLHQSLHDVGPTRNF